MGFRVAALVPLSSRPPSYGSDGGFGTSVCAHGSSLVDKMRGTGSNGIEAEVTPIAINVRQMRVRSDSGAAAGSCQFEDNDKRHRAKRR